MTEVTIACSGDCGWSVTLPKEEVDTRDLKEEYCDDDCDKTLIYDSG